MYFNFYNQIVVRITLLLIGSLILSCSGENKSSQEIPVVQVKSSQCLKESKTTIRRYIDGEINENSEVVAFWDCVENAIDIFSRYSKGQLEGLYTANELRNFLHQKFQVWINDELKDELMEIKKLFLGGSNSSISKKELNDTVELIQDLKLLTIELLPHIRVINDIDTEQTKVSLSELNSSLNALFTVTERLVNLIEKNKQEYTFSHLTQFAIQMHRFARKLNFLDNKESFYNSFFPLVGKLKSQLLGGSFEVILPGEWNRIVKTVVTGLSIWMRTEHLKKSDVIHDTEESELAFREIKKSFLSLGVNFKNAQGSISWEEIEKDLKEYSTKYLNDSSLKLYQKYQRFLPSFQQIQKLLISPFVVSEIKDDQWIELFNIIGISWTTNIRINQLISPNSWFSGLGLFNLDQIVNEVLKVLTDSINKKELQNYSYEELEGLFVALEKSELLPFKITAESLNRALVVVLQELLLSQEQKDRGVDSNSFNIEHISYIKERWKILNFRMNAISNNSLADLLVINDEKINDFINLIKTSPRPFIRENGKLIVKQKDELTWTFDSLRELAIAQWAAEILIDPGLENGITSADLDFTFEDLIPIGMDVGFFHKDDEEAAQRLIRRVFIESELFMPHSNGDGYLDTNEAAEYLISILSGIKIKDTVLSLLPHNCASEDNGFEYVNRECFVKVLKENFNELNSHTPYLIQSVKNMTIEKYNVFIENLINTIASEYEGHENDIEASDVRDLFILSQYIELFFVQYSMQNEPDVITVEEALNAFPVYNIPLQSIIGVGDQDDREALFTYLMAFGDLPEDNEERLNVLNEWKSKRPEWEFKADRIRVLQIFGTLNKILSSE